MGRDRKGWPSESDRQRVEEQNRRSMLDKGVPPEEVARILRQREAQWHRYRQQYEARERVRAEYGDFFAAMHAIIARYDPLGLIWSGDPPEITETEYDNQVGKILPRRQEARTVSDVNRIVDEEFASSFGADVMQLPYRQERMKGLADEIWLAWCQQRGSTRVADMLDE